MSVKSILKAIPASTIDSATISGTYEIFGNSQAGIPLPCMILKISNGGTTDVYVSFDGTTDHDYVIKGTTLEINAQANSLNPGRMAEFPKGTKVYVKGTAGTGNIVLSGYYQPQGVIGAFLA